MYIDQVIIFLALDLQKLLITLIRDKKTKDSIAICKCDSTLSLYFVLLSVFVTLLTTLVVKLKNCARDTVSVCQMEACTVTVSLYLHINRTLFALFIPGHVLNSYLS